MRGFSKIDSLTMVDVLPWVVASDTEESKLAEPESFVDSLPPHANTKMDKTNNEMVRNKL